MLLLWVQRRGRRRSRRGVKVIGERVGCDWIQRLLPEKLELGHALILRWLATATARVTGLAARGQRNSGLITGLSRRRRIVEQDKVLLRALGLVRGLVLGWCRQC